MGKTLPRGAVVGSRYEIQRSLGTGGMGVVYKARDRVLDEVVAVKVLRPEFALEPDMARRFQSEIKLARKVTHKNVCRIHEYGQEGDLAYISMELVSGTDLREVVRVQGGLLPEGAFDVALEIAAGLQAIHEVGIVHRDLKTQNIMIDSRGIVRLLDFGIAKEGGTQRTATGMIIGTPEYMSPEQAKGDRVDQRSDVYSLGIVIFELFTGRVPFSGDNPMATLYKQVHEAPPLEDGSLPAPVVPVLRKALAKQREERYGSVREMAEALREAQAAFLGAPAPAALSEIELVEEPEVFPVGSAADDSRLLSGIDAIARALDDEPGVQKLLGVVVGASKEMLRAESGRAVLLQARGTELCVEAAAGDASDDLVGKALPRGEGIAPLVVETGTPVLLPRSSQHPRYSKRCDELPTSLPGFLCVPLLRGQVRGALMVAGREPAFGALDQEMLGRLAGHARVALDGTSTLERSLDAFTHMSELLVSFLERVDTLYPEHSRAVATLADVMAPHLGLTASEQLHLHFGGLLHDIGKLRLEPALLQEEGEFSAEQRRRVEEHVVLGVQLLAPLTPWRETLDIVHAHHERWDGKGYPRGLAGEEIPFGARIVSVADAYDAITTAKRKAPAEALDILAASSGTQFDSRVVQVFTAVQKDRLAHLRL
jgi:putative nucleotidyltransferase with HDIG domain